MKITIYIGSLIGGGAERVCCNLANYLSESGHDVSMLLMSETTEQYPLNQNVKKFFLTKLSEKRNKLFTAIKRYSRVKKYIKTTDVDCYIVMLPITISLLLHFRSKIKGKIIASERNDPLSSSKLSKFSMKWYAKHADAWVFQTEDARKWYEPYVKNKTIVIPNAINSDFIRPEYTGEREKSIVGVGRLSEQKNFQLLLDAFAKVSPDYPEYVLKIFGKGPLENELKLYAEKIGVLQKTQFMGYVSNMPEQLEKAGLFVLSSDYEGMPNALMEAMALGLPCISTDCPAGGSKFLIDDGENGLLVPVGDREKMVVALRKILGDKDFAEKIGKNARKVAVNLAPEYIYSKWGNFIKEVVEKDDLYNNKI